MSEVLTITEVSRRSGVASSALRFYEERGLIRSERAGSGHRRQKMGLQLEEIAGRDAGGKYSSWCVRRGATMWFCLDRGRRRWHRLGSCAWG